MMMKLLLNEKITILQYATMILGVSVTDIKEIFAIACFAISLIIGLFNLVMMIIKAARDGKIDKEEMKEILEQMQELKELVDKSLPEELESKGEENEGN